MVSRISPLAVRFPTRLYQAPFPNSLIPPARAAAQQGAQKPRHSSPAGSKLARCCGGPSKASSAARRAWAVLQVELRDLSVCISAVPTVTAVDASGESVVLCSGALAIVQAEVIRQAKAIPIVRRIGIASYPSCWASLAASAIARSPSKYCWMGKEMQIGVSPCCLRRNRA